LGTKLARDIHFRDGPQKSGSNGHFNLQIDTHLLNLSFPILYIVGSLKTPHNPTVVKPA